MARTAGNQPTLFDHVLIAGVGLLGGSLGMALKRGRLVRRVTGLGRSADRLRLAQRLGAIDAATLDPASAREADLVVLAAPIGAFTALLQGMRRHLGPGTIVTDVGSAKAGVLRSASEILPPEVVFVGGHPMAGKETSGVQHADPYLFRGARWVLTPVGRGPAEDEALSLLVRMVEGVGATPVILGSELHDRSVAAISHLPQLVAVALMEAAAALEQEAPGALGLAAGGFRETTRIAASDPTMWRDICLANGPAILEALAAFEKRLGALRRAVQKADGGALEETFERVRRARQALGGSERL